MKLKTTLAPRTTKPMLSLRAQVLFRDREGQLTDVTQQNQFGLRRIADDGALALHILNQCRKRLDLLALAAERRPQLDASLVRLAVDDLRSELESGSHLVGHVEFIQELFSNSEAIDPGHMSGEHTTSRALSITKPAS